MPLGLWPQSHLKLMANILLDLFQVITVTEHSNLYHTETFYQQEDR